MTTEQQQNHDDDDNDKKSNVVRITRPTFLLDKSKCVSNLQRMKAKVDRANNDDRRRLHPNGSTSTSMLRFRPHCKTHASIEVGRWMKEHAGVDCITVSSLTMAKYFSKIFNDITVAFTVNILEIDTINELVSVSNSNTITDATTQQQELKPPLVPPRTPLRLNLLVENVEAVQFLHQHLIGSVGVYIKIDSGYGRTGIHAENLQRVVDIAHAILSLPSASASSHATNLNNKLVWKGLLTHAGHSYNCQTKEEIMTVHRTVRTLLLNLRTQLQAEFPNHTNRIEISIGDTPTCSAVDDPVEDWDGIDEVRPGNFVFYDVEQAQKIGSCTFDDVAVAVACPIVARHPDRRELILYGGGVHLSKDRCNVRVSSMSTNRHDDNRDSDDSSVTTIYGRVARSFPPESGNSQIDQLNQLNWGEVIDGMYLRSTSQEHGIIVVPPDEDFDSYRVGDVVKVLPVHSCMTAGVLSHRGYLTTDGQWISRMKD